MKVTLNIPDSVAQRIGAGSSSVSRELLEGCAVQGCRMGKLSTFQVRQLLGLQSRFGAEDFLAGHGVFTVLDADEVPKDIETMRLLRLI